jgi:hypothetical protein
MRENGLCVRNHAAHLTGRQWDADFGRLAELALVTVAGVGVPLDV